MRELGQIVVMAVRDLLDESLTAVWTVLGLAAMVTPLLVLFGLKNGLVSSLESRMIESSTYREVRPTDFRSYTQDWFDQLRARPEVAFVIPDTRLLFSPIDLFNAADPNVAAQTGTMRPTMQGDPFLEEWGQRVEGQREVVVSSRLATSLAVAEGSKLIGSLSRRRATEFAEVELTVVGVLPRDAPRSMQRNEIYVSLPLLVGAERFREEEEVRGLTQPGELPDPDTHPWSYGSFRAFAHSIDDVLPLVDWLEAQDIPMNSEYSRIAEIQQLDQALTLVFLILALVASVGGAISMGASVYAGVLRKRHELSLLRLIGFSTRSIVLFPVMQSMLLAILGALLAIGGYLLVEPVANLQLGSSVQGLFGGRLGDDEPLALLLPQHYVAAFAVIVLGSTATAAAGAWRARSISPAEGMHRE